MASSPPCCIILKRGKPRKDLPMQIHHCLMFHSLAKLFCRFSVSRPPLCDSLHGGKSKQKIGRAFQEKQPCTVNSLFLQMSESKPSQAELSSLARPPWRACCAQSKPRELDSGPPAWQRGLERHWAVEITWCSNWLGLLEKQVLTF